MTWTNDDRGKPCKWLNVIVFTEEDQLECGEEHAKKLAELDAAFKECRSAVQALIDSGEYVQIVEPQMIEDKSLETGAITYTVRARVRWLTPEAKANRERNLAAMFGAADDEFEKVMTERAGGTPH